MRTSSLIGGLGIVLAAAGLTIACDHEPARVVAPGPNTPPNVPPSVSQLQIDGPAAIPPGQSARFTAVARLTDGTSQPAENVKWFTRHGLLLVDAAGLATAGPVSGEDVVIASVQRGTVAGTASSTKEILVLPEGTFRLVGRVSENEPPAAPIAGARVELTNGAPVASVTDMTGHYRLYGVPPSADIRVTRDGYQARVQRVQLTDHQTQDFQLALSGARLELSGSYLLTVDAACNTSTPVREDLRHVTYAALLTQTDARVDVELTDASRFRINLVRRGNRFSGRVDAVGATFDLGANFYPYYGTYDPSTYPAVVERIPDGTFLTLDGTVVVRGSAGTLAGDLQGFFAHYSSRFPSITDPGTWLGSCYSTRHRFTLTRR